MIFKEDIYVCHDVDGEFCKDVFPNYVLKDIVKIKRPVKYETIYEAPKQILNKKEKDWGIIINVNETLKENKIFKEALYLACNYIVQLVDKDVNKLSYEWAEHFIEKAKKNMPNKH